MSELEFNFNGYVTASSWATTPQYMVDGVTANFASTTIDKEQKCNANDVFFRGNIPKQRSQYI
jgi:hypothetical protein